jgi:hypothetical protein
VAQRYTRLILAAVAATTLLLTGCISGTGYSDLEREPSAEDALPADLPDYATEDMEPGTIRFVVEADDRRIFLAEGTESPVCVLAVESETNWVSSCGSSMMTTTSGSFAVMVVSDGLPAEEGWSRFGENVLVRD